MGLIVSITINFGFKLQSESSFYRKSKAKENAILFLIGTNLIHSILKQKRLML